MALTMFARSYNYALVVSIGAVLISFAYIESLPLNARPGSVPALELISRAASSVGVMYRTHGPNTGSNPGGKIPKKCE